jgi:hypothetical protein
LFIDTFLLLTNRNPEYEVQGVNFIGYLCLKTLVQRFGVTVFPRGSAVNQPFALLLDNNPQNQIIVHISIKN